MGSSTRASDAHKTYTSVTHKVVFWQIGGSPLKSPTCIFIAVLGLRFRVYGYPRNPRSDNPPCGAMIIALSLALWKLPCGLW